MASDNQPSLVEDRLADANGNMYQSSSAATLSGVDELQPDPEAQAAEPVDTAIGEIQKNGTNASTSTDPKLCGVCEANPSKYKCPRCYLPYCSVVCNKIHRENHPPDPEVKPESEAKTQPIATENIPVRLLDPTNPFQILETSDRLQTLFRKYPSLPGQLLEINAATLPPDTSSETKVIPASLMRGVSKKDGWNHDIGMKRGKEALRRARKASGDAGEGIREYSKLVLLLMNEASAEHDLAEIVRQQAAQEDTQLIERLMAEENKRE